MPVRPLMYLHCIVAFQVPFVKTLGTLSLDLSISSHCNPSRFSTLEVSAVAIQHCSCNNVLSLCWIKFPNPTINGVLVLRPTKSLVDTVTCQRGQDGIQDDD